MQKRGFDFVIAAVFLMMSAGALFGGIENGRNKAKETEKPMDITSRLDRAETDIARLNVQVENLRKAIGGPVDVPNPVPPAPDPGGTVVPEPRPSPQDAPFTVGDPPLQVLNILQRNCRSCHAGAAEKGGNFALFRTETVGDDRLADIRPLDLVKMDYRVYSGMCPTDGKLVPGEDYSTLRAWISSFTDDVLKSISDTEPTRKVAARDRASRMP